MPNTDLKRHVATVFALAFLAAAPIWAEDFTPPQLDAFLDSAIDGPKLIVTMPDGKQRLLFAEADTSWDNATNHGSGRLLNLKQGKKKAALIRFNLDGIQRPTSAMLRLFVSRTGKTPQPLRVYAIDADNQTWDEETACRNNQPITDALIEEFTAVEDKTAYEVEVTEQVIEATAIGSVSFKLMTSIDGDNMYLPSREEAFAAFQKRRDGRTNAHDGHNMVGSKVLFLMALAVYRDSDAVSEMGVVVRERLLEYIHHLLIDGHEPDACGRLAWSHCPVVHALALIRHTDAVWKEMLTDSEREKTTVIMKAMVAAANYCHEDDNNFIGTVSLTGDHRKSWNPNHQEPYVAALIAGSLFFGGEELDRIFADFRYADFMADFRRLGLHNMQTTWAANTAANMECDGSVKTIPDRGSGLGVNSPCSYSGTPHPDAPWMRLQKAGASDPFGIYNNLAQRMFAWKVADEVLSGTRSIGRTQDPAAPPSPYLEQIGMLYEYRAGDALGPRSCSAYVFDGWQNNLMTAATLMAFQRWGENTDADELADLEQRMIVGSEDFRHKLTYGWEGRKNGRGSTVRGFSRQHDLMFLLWDAFVKPQLAVSQLPTAK